jgi:hypothetical protein
VVSPGSESSGMLVEIGKSNYGNNWVSTPFISCVFFQNFGAFNHYMTQEPNRTPSLGQQQLRTPENLNKDYKNFQFHNRRKIFVLIKRNFTRKPTTLTLIQWQFYWC